MSSLFKGLGDVLGPMSTPSAPSIYKSNFERVRLGQVLDVILDDSSPYYRSDFGLGVIRFRIIPDDYQKPEGSINTYAFPTDRSNYTIPLPGEQVLIYPIIVGSALYYGYGQIIQQEFNSTYNASPFIGTKPNFVDKDKLDLAVDEAALAIRFEEKLQIPIDTYKNYVPYVRNMREGDSVIEGRFGSVIYFSSTIEKNIIQSVFKGISVGKDELAQKHTTEDGDPITIIQATRRPSTTNKTQTTLIKPSINEDDSSIYLTSTQVIPIEVMTSSNMYSWNVKLVTGSVEVKKDTDTTLLTEGFPDRYDPNFVFAVNINGTIVGGGSSFGGGGLSGASLGLPESEALAYDLILSHEGTILEAMWDISNWRIGHGSSTFTLTDGTVVKLPGDPTKWPTSYDPATKTLKFTEIGNEATTVGNKMDNGWMWKSKNSNRPAQNLITQADADRDLARRVRTEFLPDTKAAVVSACKKAGLDGEQVWTNLGKGAHAALCSIKYNYGNVTKNGAAEAAARSKGDRNVLADWIQNQLEGGSKERHAGEAYTCRTGQMGG